MNQILEYALKYARLGWHVFPCNPREKTPLGSLVPHGVKDATTDEGQIRQWWSAQPDANVALACGRISGVYACDVDVSDSVSGWESLKKAKADGHHLPETIMQLTPRGGAHLFFVTDDPPRNHNSKGPDDPFFPGIDIRGDGYYVVLTPSIHPNGGRYAWDTGRSPWQLRAAVWPTWLRPSQNTPKPSAPILAQAVASECGTGDVIRRASAYLATCDPAIEGLGGHGRLLTACSRMVHGFLLTDSQAFDLLAREYNPRCDPPWDLSSPKELRDFSRKITEARKLTPDNPRGWLLADSSFAPLDTSRNMSADQVKALIEDSQKRTMAPTLPNETVVIKKFTGEMHKSAEWKFLTRPTGLLGDICSWINSTARVEQPLINLGAALAFCGVLFGRKIRTDCGLRSNLYCMGIGDTSSGKNHGKVLVRKLSAAALCDKELLGGADFASDSSIEQRIERCPATLFLLDEVGHLLANAQKGRNPHLVKIVPLLMQLYSCAGDVFTGREYADAEKQRRLVQPCCCIWGVTTPNEFCKGLSVSDIESGWLSRCLVFRTDSVPEMRWDKIEAVPPEALVQRVSDWFTRKIAFAGDVPEVNELMIQRDGLNSSVAPPQLIVPITNGAHSVFKAMYYSTRDIASKSGEFCSLWLKCIENAKKIALIVAASENFDSPVITPAIADYSSRLVVYLMHDFCEYTAHLIYDNPMDAKKKKILAIIRGAGLDGISKRATTRRTQRFCNGAERNMMLDDLIEAEEIFDEVSKNRHILRTRENHIKYMEDKK